MTNEVIKFLQANWPQLLPTTDTGSQGPDTLYEQRQPFLIPEEYMLSGEVRAEPATARESRGPLGTLLPAATAQRRPRPS
eukprot:2793627-Prymnesium_polylepis.2